MMPLLKTVENLEANEDEEQKRPPDDHEANTNLETK
jgi:hypothetical protein